MPSAEQADNRRRRRAEHRIPQIAQDTIGLLTLTERNKAPAVPASRGAATTSAPDSSRPAPRSEPTGAIDAFESRLTGSEPNPLLAR